LTDNVLYVMERVGHEDQDTHEPDLPAPDPPAPTVRRRVRPRRQGGAWGVRRPR